MDWVGMAGYLIGSFIGGILWFSLIALIANLCMIRIKDRERRPQWFLTGGLALVGLGGTVEGMWFQAIALLPPIIAVWWMYRRIMRKRVNARPKYPDLPK